MPALVLAMLLTGAGAVAGQDAPRLPVVAPTPSYPAAPPSPLHSGQPPVRARANLNAYFIPEDYPAAAREGDQGTVGVRLTVAPNGRASACNVISSSGSAIIDQATCRILRSRARYTPARNAAGDPVEGFDVGRVTWRLPWDGAYDRVGLPRPSTAPEPLLNVQATLRPRDYPAEALRRRSEGTSLARVVASPAGRVIACELELTSGSPALDEATCRLLTERGRYRPASLPGGTPGCGIASVSLSWSLPPARRAPAGRGRAALIPPPLTDQLAAAPGRCPGWSLAPYVPPALPPLRPPGTSGAYPYPVIAMPAVPSPPPPPPPRFLPPQRARASLQGYFSDDDYPAAALRAKAQGMVGISMTIGADGRVSNCTVTFSSGSTALDQATCRILRSRARYSPTRDAAGNPASGRDSGRIRWTLPAQ